jgi:endo-1,4-beta-xylanase
MATLSAATIPFGIHKHLCAKFFSCLLSFVVEISFQSWLPGSFSASEVTGTIIPQHVQQEIEGMGPSVTSWDVVNEVVGDGVSSGMTALQCVQNKGDWPTVTADGSGKPLVTDLSFIYAAFNTAYKYAGNTTRLAVNEYK